VKRRNIKKVIDLINKSTNNNISVNDIYNKLKIQKYEIIEIFELLINQNKVINLRSKSGYEICKKEFINYNSLINNLKTIIPDTALIKTIGLVWKILLKIIIGIIIGIIVVLLWNLFGDDILHLIRDD